MPTLRNCKGQLAGYEFALLTIIIIYAGFATYKWATKPSESSVYQMGSKPTEFTPHCAPFSCCNDKVNAFMEDKKK